jgi:hypothetical protein
MIFAVSAVILVAIAIGDVHGVALTPWFLVTTWLGATMYSIWLVARGVPRALRRGPAMARQAALVAEWLVRSARGITS